MKTIIVQAVQGKLRNARKEKMTVYLTGSLGMGKTTAAKYFYRNTPHVYLDGSNGKLLQMPEEEELADKVLIIDDISQIADVPSRQYILARVYDHKDQVVLIGRGKIPTWLAVADIEHSFL